MGKRSVPETAFFLTANSLGVLILLPFVIVFRRAIPAISPQVWGLLALTGLFQAAYYTGLAASYRRGDLSAVYPLVRAIPVVLVPLIGFTLGKGGTIGAVALAGMAVVLAGCLTISWFESRKSSFPYRRVLLPVLIAAAGTAGYSIVDDYALSLFRPAVQGDVPAPAATAVYAFIEGVLASGWLTVIWTAERRLRTADEPRSRVRPGSAAIAGIGIYLAYTLVLVSMGFVTNVSYVVAFRQLSIPLGTIIGISVLRENPGKGKLIGSAVVFCGLVLVAIG